MSATATAVHCNTGEAQRLVNNGAQRVGRNSIDIDKLDSCNEHLAGLGAVFCFTFFLWAVTIPFFDFATMSWVKGWESGRLVPLITMLQFKESMHNTYADSHVAFLGMDADKDNILGLNEFTQGTTRFVPPLNASQSGFAFTGLDLNRDQKLDANEFEEACTQEQWLPAAARVVVASTTTSISPVMVTTGTQAPTTPSIAIPISPTTFLQPTTTVTTPAPAMPTAPPATVVTTTHASATKTKTLSTTATVTKTSTGTHTESKTTTASKAATATRATTTTSMPYDCRAGLANHALGWSKGKKVWCCKHEVVGCSTTVVKTTTSVGLFTTLGALQTGPVDMADFKKRMGPAMKDSPRDAFSALDPNHDENSELDEFVNATMRFKPPLSIMQSEDVFAHLDTNRDSVVQAMEFFNAFASGHYLEAVRSTPVPLSLAQYHQRMGAASQVAAVWIELPNIDYDALTAVDKDFLRKVVVHELAQVTSVQPSAVKDLNGNVASISLSQTKHIAAGRRLLDVALALFHERQPVATRRLSHSGLVVKSRIDVPPGEISKDIIRVMTDYSTKQRLAGALNRISGLDHAFHGPVTADNIHISARRQNENAFMTIDADQDGTLDLDEFTAATQKFDPPLTRKQALYAFSGLDSDRDERLSAIEYEGYGMQHFFGTPTATGPSAQMPTQQPPPGPLPPATPQVGHPPPQVGHPPPPTPSTPQVSTQRLSGKPVITMAKFKELVNQAFGTPQHVFKAFDTDASGLLDTEKFVAGTAQKFDPPLNRVQAEYGFRGLDVNHDGRVDETEFLKVLHVGHFFPTPAQLQDDGPPITMADFKKRMGAFDLTPIDTSGDDTDSSRAAPLRQLSAPLRKLTLDALTPLLTMDRNGDGVLDLQEFITATQTPKEYM